MTTHELTGLRKFVAPEITFGPGARRLAGRYAKNLGLSRVLVVTDPGVIAAGWTRDVTESLDENGVQHRVFSGVTPNPRPVARRPTFPSLPSSRTHPQE